MKRKLKIDIEEEIRKLEILTKRIVETRIIGEYRGIFKGRGLEFEEYREYTQNDDASLIDWKASARTDKLLIQEHVQERNLEVFFLVDISDKMIFGSTDKLKNEYAADLTASLAYIVLQAGDKAGIALFNDKINVNVSPELGARQFYIIAKTLVDLKNYGGKFDIAEAIKFALLYLKKNTMLIVVSDFLGLKGNWRGYLRAASKKFDLICIIVKDPRDLYLPEDTYQVVVSDPFSNKKILIDPKAIKQKYDSYAKQQENALKAFFSMSQIDFIELFTNKSFVPPILDFFEKRRRKWR